MDILTTIAEFKQHLKALGYADATMDSYRKNLDQFCRYLKAQNVADMRKVTHGLICDYQQAVMAQPIAMESKALKLRPVKRLFEYLVKTHKLLINPTEGIVKTCRKGRKIGPVLTVEEVKILMDQPNLSLRTGIRDRDLNVIDIIAPVVAGTLEIGCGAKRQNSRTGIDQKQTLVRPATETVR